MFCQPAFQTSQAHSTTALLFEDGLRKFPPVVEDGDCLFLVNDTSTGETRVYYLVAWNRAEGWFLVHEVQRTYPNQKPPRATFYVTLD